MSRQIMLDLETLGNGNNAAIISIGAYSFDTKDPDGGDGLYLLVNPESSVGYGQKMDASTVLWWLEQSDQARNELVKAGKAGINLSSALIDFSRWYIEQLSKNNKEKIPVWGNGATFDNVIITSAFNSTQITKPWSHRFDRCYRTLANMCQEVRKPEMQGTVHNALDDAKLQAKHMSMIFDKLNLH